MDIEKIKEKLDKAEAKQLAQWWCLLNRWRWPTEFGIPEDKNAKRPNKRSQIMNIIENSIGMKECLREWNIDSMPGKEFDIWWDRNNRGYGGR